MMFFGDEKSWDYEGFGTLGASGIIGVSISGNPCLLSIFSNEGILLVREPIGSPSTKLYLLSVFAKF